MNIKGIVVGCFASCFLLAHGAIAGQLIALPPQPADLAWPTQNWETGNVPTDSRMALDELLDDAMARELGEVMGEARAIVIIHHGKLVVERYRAGFDQNTKQISWSMAKSFTSALVGRAVQIGWITDINAAMPGPWPIDDPRAKISWRQWLNMTDGLQYAEIGEPNVVKNDVVQMMFGRGRFDAVAYASQLALAHTPGTNWNYSSAGFHLIAHGLQMVIAEQMNKENIDPADMVAFAKENLFAPIGMDAQIEFDPAGTFLGGSLVWSTARDFARFGYLYLRDGQWEDQQLLPEGWVDFSRTKSPADNVTVYGAGWWINAANADDIRPKGQGSAIGPRDAFSAQGHEGQIIWIVPSRDLVIVRLGLMDDSANSWPALYDWAQKVAETFAEID